MTIVEISSIAPVLTVIGGELEDAQQLLIRFEREISRSIGTAVFTTESQAALQGFDLALQIMNEIGHIVDALSCQVSSDEQLTQPLSISGLRLERVRAKLNQCQNEYWDAGPQKNSRAVELF